MLNVCTIYGIICTTWHCYLKMSTTVVEYVSAEWETERRTTKEWKWVKQGRKREDFLPSSTVTFPLKKNFPWPLERATPRLKIRNKPFLQWLLTSSLLCKENWEYWYYRQSKHWLLFTKMCPEFLPERSPLNVCVVVIIMQHQYTFLK